MAEIRKITKGIEKIMGEYDNMTVEQLKKKLDNVADKKVPKCRNSTLLWLYEAQIKSIVKELEKRGVKFN